MKFIEQIQAKLKEKGLPVNLFFMVNVENESEIEGKVEELRVRFTDKEQRPRLMQEIAEITGVSDIYTNVLQSEGDRRVTMAKKKWEGDKSKTPNLNTDQPNDDDLTPEQKQIAELNKKIEHLTGLVTDSVSTASKTKNETRAKELLKEKGLSESLIKYVRLDDEETSIEDQVATIEADVLNIQKETITKKIDDGYRLKTGGDPSTSTSFIEEFAAEKVEQSKDSKENS